MNSTSRSDTSRPLKIPRYDLILIGAGPCGLAAASEFKHAGLNYLHLESGQLAQTVYNFPPNPPFSKGGLRRIDRVGLSDGREN